MDSRWAHRAFGERLGLTGVFQLLSDFPNHQAGELYGAWNPEMKMDDRMTVVVDPQGKIVYKTFNKQNQERDPTEALAAIP